MFVVLNTGKPAAPQTVCNWVHRLMVQVGVGAFTPHSACSASTSAAALSRINIDYFVCKVGWLSMNTFVTHYMLPQKQEALAAAQQVDHREAKKLKPGRPRKTGNVKTGNAGPVNTSGSSSTSGVVPWDNRVV